MTNTLQAMKAWNEAIVAYYALKDGMLKLLLHPDTTTEQLEMARKMYQDAYERMHNAQDLLITKYGNTRQTQNRRFSRWTR